MPATYCACTSCRARDERRFWRIVNANQWTTHDDQLAARIAAYGYTRTLNLPPIPEWDGEPAEWGTA